MTIRWIFRAVAAPSLAVALALFATACSASGGGGTHDPNGKGKKVDAAFEYRQCLREHGLKVSEPKPGEQGGVGVGLTSDMPKETMEKALKACNSKAEVAGVGKEPSQADKDKFRAYAKCMREHGIDMPDRGSDMAGSAPQGAEKQKADKADKACQGAGR